MQKLPPTQEKEKSKSVRAPAGMTRRSDRAPSGPGTRLSNNFQGSIRPVDGREDLRLLSL